ncbi:MAG: hypothetical protein JW763_01435 [candidate division Zixibacteria bacterium]|nr:hypothetical protein [candidate division Zixibacteria bacterium]
MFFDIVSDSSNVSDQPYRSLRYKFNSFDSLFLSVIAYPVDTAEDNEMYTIEMVGVVWSAPYGRTYFNPHMSGCFVRTPK